MKIRAIILFIIILLMLLSACADASVSYILSDDNSVNIDYSLTLTPSGKDVSTYISLIKQYWNDNGFTTDKSEKDGVYIVKGSKSTSLNSRSEAAAEFSSAFTDKDSLFYNVSFIYTPSYFEDNYKLTASISLLDIIRKNEGNRIPEAEVKSFLKSAEDGTYKLSIALPGEVQQTNADEQNGQVCTWLLKYGDERDINITTKKTFDDNISQYASLNETKRTDNQLFLICCAAAAVSLAVIIIVIITRRSRRA